MPEKETVTDASQGVQLATIQQLAHYWRPNTMEQVRGELKALPNS